MSLCGVRNGIKVLSKESYRSETIGDACKKVERTDKGDD